MNADQQRESHLVSLKVMRLSRPSLVAKHGLYIEQQSPSTMFSSSGSILTNALTSLSATQLERVHASQPPALSTLIAQGAALSEPSTPGLVGDQPTKAETLGEMKVVSMCDYGLSELLTMPASFGNIYLGETFSSYICANNESGHPVRDVILKAELQTSTLRFTLSNTMESATKTAPSSLSSPSSSSSPGGPVTNVRSNVGTNGHIQLLESGKTNEMVISHEIKELGIHILVCSVQYTTLDGQQKSFRKFYKFQVLNPLSVKTKVNHPALAATNPANSSHPGQGPSVAAASAAVAAATGGRVLLETMVQNVSGVIMWMERMRFEVSDAFVVEDLNITVPHDDDEQEGAEPKKGHESTDRPKLTALGSFAGSIDSVASSSLSSSPSIENSLPGMAVSIFGRDDYFAPNDIRQYLYVLKPKPGKELQARTTHALGKMDILWRSQFGETGRLQTSQLTRKNAAGGNGANASGTGGARVGATGLLSDEILVQVVKVPERIRLEELFSIEIMVRNQGQASGGDKRIPDGANMQSSTSTLSSSGNVTPTLTGTGRSSMDQNTMKLMLTGIKQKMGAVLLNGANSRQLGQLRPGEQTRVSLEWFPLTSGVQKVGGIRIIDVISGYSLEIDHLASCFVEHT